MQDRSFWWAVDLSQQNRSLSGQIDRQRGSNNISKSKDVLAIALIINQPH